MYASAASAWEIAIELTLGKLRVPPNLMTWLSPELPASEFTPLPISLSHALQLEHLPRHHADPLDRVLIAQAMQDDLTIVTGDPVFESYDVRVIWC